MVNFVCSFQSYVQIDAHPAPSEYQTDFLWSVIFLISQIKHKVPVSSGFFPSNFSGFVFRLTGWNYDFRIIVQDKTQLRLIKFGAK